MSVPADVLAVVRARCSDYVGDAVAELIESASRWKVIRQFASGEDFDRWEEMARGGHIPSDIGNEYADMRATALGNVKGVQS